MTLVSALLLHGYHGVSPSCGGFHLFPASFSHCSFLYEDRAPPSGVSAGHMAFQLGSVLLLGNFVTQSAAVAYEQKWSVQLQVHFHLKTHLPWVSSSLSPLSGSRDGVMCLEHPSRLVTKQNSNRPTHIWTIRWKRNECLFVFNWGINNTLKLHRS